MILPRAAPKSRNLVSGTTHNAMVDLIEDLRGRSASAGRGTPAFNAELLVRNDSGGDVGRFGVLAISGVVFDPAADIANLPQFLNQPIVTGDTPNPATYSAFVVTQEPIASGGFGRAVIQGLTVVTLDDDSAGATTAGMGDNATRLVAGGQGATVLWSDGSGLAARALVVLGGTADLFAIAMTRTGGSAGDGASPCSFTYTVNNTAGLELATAYDPGDPGVWRRPALGAMLEATHGLARVEPNGSGGTQLVVYWCNEVEDIGGC